VLKLKPAASTLESSLAALASDDGLVRLKARKSLVALGETAVQPLSDAMKHSEVNQVRWEAAKALNKIASPVSIQSFVEALEDSDPDVAWVAADALGKFKKAAWPAILDLLTKDKAGSLLLRQGAHHVFRNQREEGYNDLLEKLLKSLESASNRVSVTADAYEILRRLKHSA